MQPSCGSVRYLLAGAFHSLAYVAWGDPAADVVLCVHGLTRNGRDFDMLAEALADRFHVICPDLPGRGESDWLPNPDLYQPASYVAALSHLLSAIGRPVAWVGTSLGGICGMLVAAATGQPITRLVLNDIGPLIPAASLRRIRDYLPGPEASRFADLDAIEQYLRRVHAPFGPLSDAQWAFLARISARAVPEEGFTLHYDPRIAEPMRAAEPEDIDLWHLWERISVPMLVVRGAESDLLLPETLARMAQAGARTFVVPDTGHAPALMEPEQVAAVRAFLESARSCAHHDRRQCTCRSSPVLSAWRWGCSPVHRPNGSNSTSITLPRWRCDGSCCGRGTRRFPPWCRGRRRPDGRRGTC